MEFGGGWEQSTLVQELTLGMELTKKLSSFLDPSPSSLHNREVLLQGILASYDNALSALKPTQSPPLQLQLESPVSLEGSPDTSHTRKRKLTSKQVHYVRAGHGSGPVEDGYNWRKYGQKDILGAKHPRSYYRCTYRHSHDCWATKQLQRSDEDPSLFEITYKGSHTCIQQNLVSVPPGNQEREHKIARLAEGQQFQRDGALEDVHADTCIKNEDDLQSKDTLLPFSSPAALGRDESKTRFSSPWPFIAPETPELNCVVASSCGMRSMPVHHPPSRPAEICSAADSPVVDLDFSFGSFPFDSLDFFS